MNEVERCLWWEGGKWVLGWPDDPVRNHTCWLCGDTGRVFEDRSTMRDEKGNKKHPRLLAWCFECHEKRNV